MKQTRSLLGDLTGAIDSNYAGSIAIALGCLHRRWLLSFSFIIFWSFFPIRGQADSYPRVSLFINLFWRAYMKIKAYLVTKSQCLRIANCLSILLFISNLFWKLVFKRKQSALGAYITLLKPHDLQWWFHGNSRPFEATHSHCMNCARLGLLVMVFGKKNSLYSVLLFEKIIYSRYYEVKNKFNNLLLASFVFMYLYFSLMLLIM